MRNSFNLLLIVLAWFDIFFIIIAVLDYSVARGTSLFLKPFKAIVVATNLQGYSIHDILLMNNRISMPEHFFMIFC